MLNFNNFNLIVVVDAGGCGEGNLEITISARGRNVPRKCSPKAVPNLSSHLYP